MQQIDMKGNSFMLIKFDTYLSSKSGQSRRSTELSFSSNSKRIPVAFEQKKRGLTN